MDVLWPNQQEPVDGVIPVMHVSQDPYFFDVTLGANLDEMEA